MFVFGRSGRFIVAMVICLGVSASVAAIRPPSAGAALPDSVAIPIARAKAALTRIETRIANHRYAKALESLKALRRNVVLANRAATDQIGKPPVDPESDDPPGPDCVFAVLKLDHGVTMRLVLLFDGLRNADVVLSLRYRLSRTHVERDAMLDEVIALPPEGARADYDDGMADTLTTYTAEKKRITTALHDYQLTNSARFGLNNALARVKATETKVNDVWGGGE